jgi:hypothetical protein
MSTHLKLNLSALCFNGPKSPSSQSHDDSKEGVLSTDKPVQTAALLQKLMKRKGN